MRCEVALYGRLYTKCQTTLIRLHGLIYDTQAQVNQVTERRISRINTDSSTVYVRATSVTKGGEIDFWVAQSGSFSSVPCFNSGSAPGGKHWWVDLDGTDVSMCSVHRCGSAALTGGGEDRLCKNVHSNKFKDSFKRDVLSKKWG